MSSNPFSPELSRALVAIAAVFLLGSLAAGGAVAIDGPEFGNETVSIDENTSSTYVEVTNVSNGPVNVTVSGIANGTETVQNETQIDAVNTTTLKEFPVDSSTYDSYRIVIAEDASSTDTQTVEAVDIGAIGSGGSGGGGLLGGENTTLYALIVVAAGAFLFMEDD